MSQSLIHSKLDSVSSVLILVAKIEDDRQVCNRQTLGAAMSIILKASLVLLQHLTRTTFGNQTKDPGKDSDFTTTTFGGLPDIRSTLSSNVEANRMSFSISILTSGGYQNNLRRT